MASLWEATFASFGGKLNKMRIGPGVDFFLFLFAAAEGGGRRGGGRCGGGRCSGGRGGARGGRVEAAVPSMQYPRGERE